MSAATLLGLPLGDPQFWAVTAIVGLIAGLAVRRVVRSTRDEDETPCANCPKAPMGFPAPGGAGAPRRTARGTGERRTAPNRS